MPDRAPPEPPPRRHLTGLRGLVGALRNLGLIGLGAGDGGVHDSFVAADGQQIPVYMLGDGPPVVLVHGLGCSHRQWMPVARRLARRHCVLASDARGHGRCRPVHGTITLKRLAADLADMLDHYGLIRPTLVGHSMGALTLMQYLRDHGTRRVSAVVLIDQSPRIVTDDEWRLGLFGACSASMLSAFIAGARRDPAEAVLNEIGAFGGNWLRRRLAADAPLGRVLRRRLSQVDVQPLLSLAESLTQADFRASLARVDVPLWVVLGARSPHYAGLPLDAWYRETVRHAEVSVYERAGHSPHVSEAGRFADQLLEFLEDHL